MNIGKRKNRYATWAANFLRKNRSYFFGIFTVGLIINNFFIDGQKTIFGLILFALTVVLIFTYRVAYYVSFRIMGALLLFTFLFLLFSNETTAEKFAIWAYLLLLIGSVQYLVELRKTLN